MLGLAGNWYGMLGSRSQWTGSDNDNTKLTLNPMSANKTTLYNGVDYDSSAIEKVRFDPNTNNAKITYVGGGKEYDFPMTQQEFDRMKWSGSKGQWVAYKARRY